MLIQGTKEWVEARKSHFCSSEAAAMLGICPYKTREALLREKVTGELPAITDYQQALFDRGHAAEFACRSLVEAIIKEPLYTPVITKGKLMASCDGLTLNETRLWEHKLWNKELVTQLTHCNHVRSHHMAQIQHALYVTGADVCYYSISDGTAENHKMTVIYPDDEWRQKIIIGWQEFEKDMKEYNVSTETVAGGNIPQIFNPSDILNIPPSKVLSYAKDVISEINAYLVSDQDFADAEIAVKWCSQVEKNIEETQETVINLDPRIAELLKTLDEINGLVRDKRLDLSGKVKKKKEQEKSDLIAKAKSQYIEFVSKFDIPICHPANFSEWFHDEIKGKKTISSIKNAIDAELIRLKIAAVEAVDGIEENRNYLKSSGIALSKSDMEKYERLPHTAFMSRVEFLRVQEGKMIDRFAAELPPETKKLLGEFLTFTKLESWNDM